MATETYKGSVPAHLLYDTQHDMWVRREGGEVVIGATSFGLHLAGEVIAFTAKPTGAEVAAGRGLGTVESAKTVLAVHSPVAFRLDTPNEAPRSGPTSSTAIPTAPAGWPAARRSTGRTMPRTSSMPRPMSRTSAPSSPRR